MKRFVTELALVSLLVAAAFESARGQSSRDEIRRVDGEARAAHEKKEYAAFLSASRRLVELAPRSTRALYNLACASALSGSTGEALSLLERLARMGVYFDVGSDEDLASLRNEKRFRTISKRMKALEAPLGRATEAARLGEKDFLTEGVANDPKTGDFFVSSVHRRKVVRILRERRAARLRAGRSRRVVERGRSRPRSGKAVALRFEHGDSLRQGHAEGSSGNVRSPRVRSR